MIKVIEERKFEETGDNTGDGDLLDLDLDLDLDSMVIYLGGHAEV